MSRLDDLPPDQRAALSLLLAQGRRYAEVAGLLGIEERAVHDRAHAALAVLAPARARGLSAEQREQLGEYLLGQQAQVGERLRARSLLAASDAARAWASAIAAELAPLSATELPEIPNGATPASTPPPAFAPPPPPGAHPARQLPSSRLGGALLLAAIVAAVVVAVVLLTGGGGGSKKTPGTAARGSSGATSTKSSGGTSASAAKEDRRLTLTSPDPASKAVGAAEVLSEGSQYAFYLAAEHLAPTKGFFYAVWLYNSPTSHEAISRAPSVSSNGRLQGGALLPANAGNYHRMLLTRETSEHPTEPGPTVLSGAFGLH